MRKSLRYLRIAFSATCLIACLLLIVLWARSYWRNELCYWTAKNRIHTSIGSNTGVVWFNRNKLKPTLSLRDWTYANYPPHKTVYGHWWFWDGWNQRIDVGIPHWCLALPISILGSLPWLRYRFSLRTLLIATTLVAAVLGTIVWFSR